MRPPALCGPPNNARDRSPTRGDILQIHQAETSSPDELRTLEDLARLTGVQEVRSFGDGYSVAFPEADFVISMSGPGPEPGARPDGRSPCGSPSPA